VPDAIQISKLGESWVAASQGVVLTIQRRLSEAIRLAVSAASERSRRGTSVEVTVNTGDEFYSVWNSDRDGYSSGAE